MTLSARSTGFCILSLLIYFHIYCYLLKYIYCLAMKTKQSRREFLRVSATGALGAIVISKSDWKTSEATSSRLDCY